MDRKLPGEIRLLLDSYMYSVIVHRAQLLDLNPGEFVAAAVHFALDSDNAENMEEKLLQYAGRERAARDAH